MGEGISLVLLVFGLIGVMVGGVLVVAAIVLLMRASALVDRQRRELKDLSERVSELEEMVAAAERPAPQPEPVEAAPAAPAEAPALAEQVPATEQVRAVLPGAEAPAAAPVQEPVRRPGTDWTRLEQALGRRWLTWVGVLALFVAVGLFVKLAFEQGWISPPVRVVSGVVVGIILVAVGERFVRREMRPLGQGLIGGGLAIAYVSLYAGFALYDLIPQGVAFGAMILVTAVGVALAVLHDAMPVSFLAVLGGLLTPVLLAEVVDRRDTLFCYLMMLDLGVLAVALFRRWRALDVLAFAGTATLFGAWFAEFYDDAAMVPTLLWLGAFYAVFLLLPFVHHLYRRTSITLERFLMAVANGLLAFSCAHAILHAEHEHALGFVALGMAACYVALGTGVRKRIPDDARGAFGFIALAVFFGTLAIPLHLGLHGITLAWSAEGPLLLYLGYRYRYRPVRVLAFVVVVLALIRLFAVHWPLREARLILFLNRPFGVAMFFCLAAGAFAAIHQWYRPQRSGGDRSAKLASAIGAGLLALVFLHAELGCWFQDADRMYLGQCALAVLWAIGALAFLAVGVTACWAPSWRAGLVPLAVAAVLAVRNYDLSAPAVYLPAVNVRFLAGLVAVVAVFAHVVLLRRFRPGAAPGRPTLGGALLWVGVVALLLLLSVEPYVYCRRVIVEPARAQWMSLMSLSVVWAAYAGALLVIGFWRRFQALRFAALGLFGITALKLVLVDIAGVKQLYRVVSFLVLGVLMIAAAYLYHRLEERIEAWFGART